MSYTEAYEYKLTRTYEDGSVELIISSISVGKNYVTHDKLAVKFNEFLDSCGYVGHNYINHRDRNK